MKIMKKILMPLVMAVVLTSMAIAPFEVAAAVDNTETADNQGGDQVKWVPKSEMENLDSPILEGYVFAGWYKVQNATAASDAYTATPGETDAAYAKFVPAKVLRVKLQLSAEALSAEEPAADATASLRFVTTVDNLLYQKVGFQFVIDEKTSKRETTTVYSHLYQVGEENVDASLEPSSFCSASNFFLTYTITEIPLSAWSTDIQITPYWVTLDGTTVYGEAVTKRVNQGRYDARIGSAYYGTLAEAVSAANGMEAAAESPVEIYVQRDAAVTTTMTINNDITINAQEGSDVTINAGSCSATVFTVNAGKMFTLGSADKQYCGQITVSKDEKAGRIIDCKGVFNLGYNSTLTKAKSSAWGNVILNTGTCNLYGNVKDNSCSQGSSTATTGCVILNNHINAVLNICDGKYLNNACQYGGGALVYDNAYGTINASGGHFINNSSYKGGVFGGKANNSTTNNNGTKINISGGEFTCNSATERGGVIWAEKKTVVMITGGVFEGNSANVGGGVIGLQDGATTEISGAVMKNNYVSAAKTSGTYQGGGAVLLTGASTVTLTNCTIKDNLYVGAADAAGNADGCDIAFRGNGATHTKNLILTDSSFDGGIIGWHNTNVSGTACQVIFKGTVEGTDEDTVVPLVFGKRYTVDCANKALVEME